MVGTILKMKKFGMNTLNFKYMKERILELIQQYDLSTRDIETGEDKLSSIVNAMLEFGKQVEQITKEKCAENAVAILDEIYLEDGESPKHLKDTYDDWVIANAESYDNRYFVTNVSKDSILNTPSIFETH